MSVTVPDNEPSFIRAGDTTSWNKDVAPDYPATDGWSLLYTLTLQSDFTKRLQITATANGAAFLATLTAAQTAALTPGIYNLFGHVSKASDRYQIYHGTIEVKPNLAALTSGDYRSTVKKTLDAIEAVLLGRAALDQQSMEINGRRLDRTSIPDLITLRDRFKAEYVSERNAERIANGLGSRSKVLTRFV